MIRAAHIVAAALLPLMLAGSSCARSQEAKGKEEKSKTQKRATVEPARRAWLGVATRDLTREKARDLKSTVEEGALVIDVVDESPAEKAGIQENDIIVEVNGKPIADADDLVRAVRKADPGSAAAVVVLRKGEKKTCTATLGKAPRGPESPSISFSLPRRPFPPRVRFWSGSALYGFSLMELNRQLREYFEVPAGQGVLVEHVEQKSAAEKSGLKAGDVIVRVGKTDIESTGDVVEALEQFDTGEKADVEVIRKGKRSTLTIEIEETPHERNRHRYYWHGSIENLPELEELHELEQLPEVDGEIDHAPRHEGMKELEIHLRSMGREIKDSMRHFGEALRAKLTLMKARTI